jgi:peptidyl-tRNA hydrolase, PTH1 family
MKIIFGLGNPGAQYLRTRHNAGFRVVDYIAEIRNFPWTSSKRDQAEIASGLVDTEKALLVKPQTYMNLSGQTVLSLTQFYKLPLADILIIADDLDLPVGKIRFRQKGSGGGQRGMASIIQLMGSNDFARLRIGIGRPVNSRMEIVPYVLSAPSGEEALALTLSEERAAEAALHWLREGTAATMNRYNADFKSVATSEPEEHP